MQQLRKEIDNEENSKDDIANHALSKDEENGSDGDDDDDSDGDLLVPTGKTTLTIDEKNLPTLPKREKRRLRLSVGQSFILVV